MPWSVGSTGKAPAVAKAIESQFKSMEGHPCPEPEETAKQHVRKALAAILEGHTQAATSVKVEASGSMNWRSVRKGDVDVPTEVANYLTVKVEPFGHLD